MLTYGIYFKVEHSLTRNLNYSFVRLSDRYEQTRLILFRYQIAETLVSPTRPCYRLCNIFGLNKYAANQLAIPLND
jgi:hypothetical protein